jgi:hypothetical protein
MLAGVTWHLIKLALNAIVWDIRRKEQINTAYQNEQKTKFMLKSCKTRMIIWEMFDSSKAFRLNFGYGKIN